MTTPVIRGVVSIDPAAKGPCGVALRFVTPGAKYVRGKLPAPEWYFQGSVWDAPGLHDELSLALYKQFKPGDQVLYVAENTAYGVTAAKSMGRAIGAVESVLIDIGVLQPDQLKYVAANSWRARQLPGFRPKGKVAADRRDELKERAVSVVNALYGLGLTDDQADAAEAVLINDDAVLHILPTVGGARAGK